MDQNSSVGQLKVGYFPCDSVGTGEPDDETLVEEPEELLGQTIYFNVQVDAITNLPPDLCTDVFVTYALKHEPDNIHKVPVC